MAHLLASAGQRKQDGQGATSAHELARAGTPGRALAPAERAFDAARGEHGGRRPWCALSCSWRLLASPFSALSPSVRPPQEVPKLASKQARCRLPATNIGSAVTHILIAVSFSVTAQGNVCDSTPPREHGLLHRSANCSLSGLLLCVTT